MLMNLDNFILILQMESLPNGLSKGFQSGLSTDLNLWHWLKVQRVSAKQHWNELYHQHEVT